jgi:hypothetical protein
LNPDSPVADESAAAMPQWALESLVFRRRLAPSA